MSKPEPRITPLRRSEWNDEVRDLFAVMDGPEGRENGPSRDIMHVLAQHPALSKPFMQLGRHVLFDSSLSDRDRELVTLYVGWTTKSDYEWLSHVVYGLQVGLTEADIEAVKQGPDSPHWSDFDRDLLRAVDQMRESFNLDDELWASLSKTFNQHQMMELVFVIGNYMLFATVLNTLRIPLEAGTEEIAKKYGLPQG